jgi:hypothetical protein
MADTEAFDIKKWILGFVNPTTWGKAIVYLIIGGVIVFAVVCVKNFFFPRKDTQTNKPIAWVAPFAKVEKGGISQDNTQVLVTEKPWEIGGGVAAGRIDNKDAYGGFLTVKRKF